MATISSYQFFVKADFRDTFRGESSIGIPDLRVTRAASGSTQKLNSALGVIFPPPSGRDAIAPPIMTSCLTLAANSGLARMACAIFVKGPSATIVISPGFSITVCTIKDTAESTSARFLANPPGGVGGLSFEYHLP